MIRSAFCALAIPALVHAAPNPHMDFHRDIHQQNMIYHPVGKLPELLRMRVYRKDGPTQPPLDSFRLIQGKPEIWRWEDESAIFKKGGKITYKLADIDSIVVEERGMAFPGPTGRHWLWPQESGAINFYAFEWEAKGLPAYLKKGDGAITRTHAKVIREMVEGDEEATAMIDRYSDRWKWRLGISAVGVGLAAGGLALAKATEVEDENGDKKPSTIGPGILFAAGLVTAVVPVTPIVNFIWKPLPKRALDTYNANRRAALTAP